MKTNEKWKEWSKITKLNFSFAKFPNPLVWRGVCFFLLIYFWLRFLTFRNSISLQFSQVRRKSECKIKHSNSFEWFEGYRNMCTYDTVSEPCVFCMCSNKTNFRIKSRKARTPQCRIQCRKKCSFFRCRFFLLFCHDNCFKESRNRYEFEGNTKTFLHILELLHFENCFRFSCGIQPYHTYMKFKFIRMFFCHEITTRIIRSTKVT